MAEDLAKALAASRKGYVVAAAGCGKTHLIAQATACCDRRQLILTHTHAGVRAILNHLRRQQVSPSLFKVATIHGFALKYASAFPILAEWKIQRPLAEEWHEVPPAAQRTLTRSCIRRVLQTSYAGVFVDEYQDCTIEQHALISALAEILPCRALGDPLQSIFWELNGERSLPWFAVEKSFEIVGELTTPHRWLPHNPRLGEWLLFVRRRLITGESIDLRDSPARWGQASDRPAQLALCKSALCNDGETIVGVRKWRSQCHGLSRYLKNQYRTLEDVECKELMDWASLLESAKGDERVNQVIAFVKKWTACLPDWIERTGNAAISGKARNFEEWEDERKRFFEALTILKANDDLKCIGTVLDCIDNLSGKPVYVSREIWVEMKKSLRSSGGAGDTSLSATAWKIRDSARRHGRYVPKRCISTTLLVKGLEFDHALGLEAQDFQDAENLYVALTRGAKSLAVLSRNPLLKRPLPHFNLVP